MAACPSSATCFARVRSEKDLNLILWYYGNEMIKSQQVIITKQDKIDGDSLPKIVNIDILKIFPGDDLQWEKLKSLTDCPGNDGKFPQECGRTTPCAFQACPWKEKSRTTSLQPMR